MDKTQLKQQRQDYGLTQQQLANLTGVSRQTIISIELGRRKLNPKWDRMFTYFFSTLKTNERLRKLVINHKLKINKKLSMNKILNNPKFKNLSANQIPSLKKQLIVLDEIELILTQQQEYLE